MSDIWNAPAARCNSSHLGEHLPGHGVMGEYWICMSCYRDICQVAPPSPFPSFATNATHWVLTVHIREWP